MEVIATLAAFKAIMEALKSVGFDPQVLTPMAVFMVFLKYEIYKLRQDLKVKSDSDETRFTKIETHVGLKKQS